MHKAAENIKQYMKIGIGNIAPLKLIKRQTR